LLPLPLLKEKMIFPELLEVLCNAIGAKPKLSKNNSASFHGKIKLSWKLTFFHQSKNYYNF